MEQRRMRPIRASPRRRWAAVVIAAPPGAGSGRSRRGRRRPARFRRRAGPGRAARRGAPRSDRRPTAGPAPRRGRAAPSARRPLRGAPPAGPGPTAPKRTRHRMSSCTRARTSARGTPCRSASDQAAATRPSSVATAVSCPRRRAAGTSSPSRAAVAAGVSSRAATGPSAVTPASAAAGWLPARSSSVMRCRASASSAAPAVAARAGGAIGTGPGDGDREQGSGQRAARACGEQPGDRAHHDGSAEPPRSRVARPWRRPEGGEAGGGDPVREAGHRRDQQEEGGTHHGTAVPRRASSAPSSSRWPVRPDRAQPDRSHDPVFGRGEHADRVEHALPRGQAPHVQHDLDRRGELAVQRRPGEAAGGGEGLHTGGYLLRRVGVHGARAAVVAGVERREQLADLRAADLADDQPVGPHPQGLPHEVAQLDAARPLDVGRPGHQPDDVRMPRPQLGHVLDGDDAFTRPDEAQQRAEDRGLAGARAAGDEERQAGFEYGAHQRLAEVVHRAQSAQGGEVVRGGPQHAQRQAGAVGGDRRQHRVQAHADVGEPPVDVRARVVEPAARGDGEPLRQPADGRVVDEPHGGALAGPGPRSTQTPAGPQTRTSVVRGSRNSSSSGPAPVNSWRRVRNAARTSRSDATPPDSARTAAATAAGSVSPPAAASRERTRSTRPTVGAFTTHSARLPG